MKILRRASSSSKPPLIPGEPTTRRVEITVERETLVSSPPPSFETYCAACARRVVMLNPASAALLAQVSIREIYRWVDARKVHFLESASGDLYLCAASLEASTPHAASADSHPEPHKTLPSGEPR